MIKEWERSKIYTKQYLDAMPEDGYGFKPTPEIRSFAAQMLHLAEANYFFASSASGNPIPEERKSIEKDVPPTKEAVTKAVMDSYDFMIHCVQSMTQEKMDEISKGKIKGIELSNSNLIGKAFEHQAHTRGQTTIYLRLRGVTPPAEKLF
jgi:uncharacterized damage-inducible protein DinB